MSQRTDNPRTIDLLRRWHSGDRDALAQLVRYNLPWLTEHVRAHLGNRLRAHEESQDHVQEAVLDVLTYGPRFEIANNAHFRALLARIVENNLRDRGRWLGRERRDVRRNQPIPSDTVLQLDPPVRCVTRPSEAGARAEREEEKEWIRLAVDLLEPRDRDAVWLRVFEGLSFEAIGQRLGTSANAARLRHRRALPRLAKKIRELTQRRIRAALAPSPA